MTTNWGMMGAARKAGESESESESLEMGKRERIILSLGDELELGESSSPLTLGSL